MTAKTFTKQSHAAQGIHFTSGAKLKYSHIAAKTVRIISAWGQYIASCRFHSINRMYLIPAPALCDPFFEHAFVPKPASVAASRRASSSRSDASRLR